MKTAHMPFCFEYNVVVHDNDINGDDNEEFNNKKNNDDHDDNDDNYKSGSVVDDYVNGY